MPVPAQVFILVASLAATVFAWHKIRQSNDPGWAKVCLALLAAVPILGPIMWLFMAVMPSPQHPGRSRIFAGPAAPHPNSPRWLAKSHQTLTYVVAFLFLAAHAFLLLHVLRAG